MKNNIKLLMVALISGVVLAASGASAHCKFPSTNKACQGKKIDKNGDCTVYMKKADCAKKGGKYTK